MAIQIINDIKSPGLMNTYWRFPSSPGCISDVERLVDHLAATYHISQDKYPNILISLTEAVNNAIIHGNQCDDCKCVHVEVQPQHQGLTLIVRDEGCGFNPDKVDDPTLPENIAKTGGRGIFLIKQLCDRVFYDDNGCTVRMCFDF